MKLDRLLGILTTLLNNNRMTAPQLAEKFEVSRRTINRDIETLCQAGIPIVTQQGGGGGISIADGYKLDKNILTTDELSSIITALRGIGSVSDKSQIERILDKLSTNKDTLVSLQEPVVIDLASHYKGSLTQKIKLIKQAIHEKKLIEFDYYSEKGQSRRRIEPYIVVFQWNEWYMFGFCLQRQDWRMFKLARLWELRLCEEDYIPREIPPEKRNFGTHLPDDKKLIALFDPTVKYQLIEAYGPNSFKETEEGSLRLEIGYTNRDYILGWLLSFGDKAKVIEPVDIADEIKKVAENILKKYK